MWPNFYNDSIFKNPYFYSDLFDYGYDPRDENKDSNESASNIVEIDKDDYSIEEIEEDNMVVFDCAEAN